MLYICFSIDKKGLHGPDKKPSRAGFGPWAVVWRPLLYRNVLLYEHPICPEFTHQVRKRFRGQKRPKSFGMHFAVEMNVRTAVVLRDIKQISERKFRHNNTKKQ